MKTERTIKCHRLKPPAKVTLAPEGTPLHPGDEVYWTVDDGYLPAIVTSIRGDAISIETDSGVLTVPRKELWKKV